MKNTATKPASGRNKQAEIMAARGYIPATEVSRKLGNDIATVYRWLDDGKIEGLSVGGRRYAKLTSLIQHIGPEAARIFGFVASDSVKAVAESK